MIVVLFRTYEILIRKIIFFFICLFLIGTMAHVRAMVPLYWWEPDNGATNFGDTLSVVLIERITGKPIRKASLQEHKLLAIGSILHFANEDDVIWGSGINGKHPYIKDYSFKKLDVRSIRGPLTRSSLKILGIDAPEIYGDPALLFPYFFPEFKKNPIRDYIIIPHISEMSKFETYNNVVLPTEPWNEIIQKIVESKFVISSSLHGIIIAEAFGIPACLLISKTEPLFKYIDYYSGTQRQNFTYARSVEEALKMGGQPLPICDLQKLIDAFPWDLFSNPE